MAPQNALEALPQEADRALCQGTHAGVLQLRLEAPHLLLLMMYMCVVGLDVPELSEPHVKRFCTPVTSLYGRARWLILFVSLPSLAG